MSKGCASADILNLLAISLINNSGLIFIYVKIMNLLTCGEDIGKLAVYSSKSIIVISKLSLIPISS